MVTKEDVNGKNTHYTHWAQSAGSRAKDFEIGGASGNNQSHCGSPRAWRSNIGILNLIKILQKKMNLL